MKAFLVSIFVTFVLFVVNRGAVAQTNLHSITLPGYVVVTNSPGTGGSGTNLVGRFVDYANGSDSNPGTNAVAPWKHCPGDPAATAVPSNTTLTAGTTVWFKGGVNYVLTGAHIGGSYFSTGIGLNWSGTTGAPITYASTNAWGNGGRAIFTDNYTTNRVVAFFASSTQSNLVFNNLEIGPIAGSASLPSDPGNAIPGNQGYGIMFYGSAAMNVTIENGYFHNLGYWYNQKPMDANSLQGTDGGPSATAIYLANESGVTITNCEFTKTFVGIDVVYSTTSSNNVITANNFHDYINWGIDLAGLPGGNLDYLTISHNNFHDMSWAYDPQYWTAYSVPPHQDPIFHRTGAPGATNGQHINLYNNQFTTTHAYEDPTAYIYLEYAASANIYNNLFDVRNAGVPGNLFPIASGGGPGMPINISYETNLPSVIRILNNTFLINSPSNSANNALEWSTAGSPALNPGLVWPSNGTLQVENNVMYSFATNSGQCLLLNIYNPTNLVATNSWTIDYNCWYDGPANFNNWQWWYTDGSSIAGIPNTTLGIGQMQTWHLEAHGTTNKPTFASFSYDSTTNNYVPASGSVLIGNGVTLASLTNVCPGIDHDIRGVTRTNFNGGWTIGAYQY